MTRPPIEQHMRVVVCRYCGARAEECGGTCANATGDWKALATFITASRPLTEMACTTSIVIGESNAELIELPCPQHPSDTRPTASHQAPSEAETTPTPATNVDTPASGTDAPTTS